MLGLEPLGRGSDVEQRQAQIAPVLGLLGKSYELLCSWLLLVLGLEPLWRAEPPASCGSLGILCWAL